MYNLILKGGQIVDGTGCIAPFTADLAIRGGRIAAIADHITENAVRTLDVSGLTVAPGFIDIHSHSDGAPLVSYRPEAKLYQGVTFELNGNCGSSIVPNNRADLEKVGKEKVRNANLPLPGVVLRCCDITEYAKQAKETPKETNYGMLVGHGDLRRCVMGLNFRNPTEEEMQKLKDRLRDELRKGAFGMSLGLIYPPSAFAETEELEELSRVVAQEGGIVSVHMRNEGPRVFEAVDEMIGIAERTGVCLEISHLKIMTKSLWGQADKLLAGIDEAKKRGVNVHADQYPYTASATGLKALVPKWAHDGGNAKIMERVLEGSELLRQGIAEEMESRGGADKVLITGMPGDSEGKKWIGKTIADVSEELSVDPVDAVLEVFRICGPIVFCNYFSQSEEDMLKILAREDICVGSDGYAFSTDPEITKISCHVRCFSTFPHAIELARDKGLLSLEKIIYKMTGLPAEVLGMKERGILKEGKTADITVFDAKNIRQTGDYMNPMKFPEGIKAVIVKGEIVLEDQKPTGAVPGSVLLRGKC